MYHGLVQVGEQTGKLDEIMTELAEYLKESNRLRDRIRGAMVYPALVLFITLIGLTALVFFLLPVLIGIFDQVGGQGVELAGIAAKFRIGMAVVILATLGLFVAWFVTARQKRKNPDSFQGFDRVVTKIPLLGIFLVNRDIQRWSFAMECLVANGFPVERALQNSLGAISNSALRHDLRLGTQYLHKGYSVTRVFNEMRSMPRHVVKWIAVGERSGQVSGVFKQLRQYYTFEVEKSALLFMNLAEPALIILVGFILMIIIGVFVMPIFSMYGEII